MFFLTAMEYLPDETFDRKKMVDLVLAGKKLTNSCHCYGFYESLKDAQDSLNGPDSSVDVRRYKFVVIERLGPGSLLKSTQVGWFEYVQGQDSWQKIHYIDKSNSLYSIGRIREL